VVWGGRRGVGGRVGGGVPFARGPHGPDLGLEAGHGRRRILHAGGGATGEAVSSALLGRVMGNERIRLVDETPVDRLLVEERQVVGVVSGERTFRAGAVILATGGYAGLWGRSTNPPGNRGIGLYLGWQAGATLADLEFVQFHPTALAYPGAPAFLLSEALRGEGALLVDEEERPVVDPLLPRDVLARAIFRRIREEGPVYLSLRGLDAHFVEERFPSLARQLRAWGLDLARDLLPVAPAAHYCMGGIRTDTSGYTGVPGLYVAGEAACTGAQGANRLASNSLLECLVFGRRSAIAALGDGSGFRVEGSELRAPGSGPHRERGGRELGELLDDQLGVERDGEGLAQLIATLPDPESECAEAGCVISGLAARAALMREESRGAHYRTDYLDPRPEWQGRILWRRGTPPRFEEVHLC
jgi:L-aspartate oxidase